MVTVTFMGWAGLKNGELLRAAEDAGVEVLLTGSQSSPCRPIQLPIIRKNLPKMNR